jgi:hypothetical protein
VFFRQTINQQFRITVKYMLFNRSQNMLHILSESNKFSTNSLGTMSAYD